MQSTPPQGRSLEEWLRQYQQWWESEFNKKLEVWKKMPHEKRVEYINSVFQKLIEKAKSDPMRAALDFLGWLNSPDGAIAWPYIWKDEYRKTMVDIGYYMIKIANKFLMKAVLQNAQGRRG